jgi:hypothetical protein
MNNCGTQKKNRNFPLIRISQRESTGRIGYPTIMQLDIINLESESVVCAPSQTQSDIENTHFRIS